MINVGVDLHKTQFTICALRNGDEVLQKEYRTGKEGYEEFLSDLKGLGRLKKDVRLAVETTGNVWYFVHVLEKAVAEIQVVNTMKFKVIVQSSSKTDNRDARTIAHYLWKDMLPTVILPDEDSRRISKLVKVRDKHVKRMTELKNQIHGLFMEEGFEIKKSSLTSVKKLNQLKTMEAGEEVMFLAGEMIDELIRLKETKTRIEKRLSDLTAKDKNVAIVRTVPGTGLVSASAIRGALADIKRFDHPKKVAAYAGLVPWVSNSNEKVHHGHITKRGSTILRNAFVQMAMGLIREWSVYERGSTTRLCNWYRRCVERKGGGKSKIALARRLSHVVWAMLQTGTPFSYDLL